VRVPVHLFVRLWRIVEDGVAAPRPRPHGVHPGGGHAVLVSVR
jgi:hypothetical protein